MISLKFEYEDREMRRSKDFSLFTIAGVAYLLPFGQGMADLRRGVQINETGAYLWELLERERTEEEMLLLCAEHYGLPASQIPQLKIDLQQFLHIMDSYGILDRSEDFAGSGTPPDCNAAAVSLHAHHTDTQAVAEAPAGKEAHTVSDADTDNTDNVRRYLSIGGLTLLLCGPSGAFSQDFDAFEIYPGSGAVLSDTAERKLFHISRDTFYKSHPTATDKLPRPQQPAAATDCPIPVDQIVMVTGRTPAQRPRSNTLLENRELIVMESDLQYTFLFPDAPGICEAHLSKDGTEACYYCSPPYTERLQKDLFHAVRLSFLYLAQLHDMIVLHSASLLYRDRAWLFSGHSGAGKSTHTNLWKELCDVPLINGDLNLLSMENGCPVVHGLPWCGTSGISDTHSYPLGGILLIKKAQKNCAAVPDDSHAQLLIAQRLISPGWTEALLRRNLRLVAELAPHILICRLHCTKTPEAVETARQAIDDYLAHQNTSLPENRTTC